MALIELTVKDIMRGSQDEITLRFDDKDLIKLSCHCSYDPALRSKDGNKVMLIKKVEVKNKDGSWSPYPSITWLDGVENEEQLLTRALIKRSNEQGIYVMSSTDGVPDGKLMSAAAKAGIYTETIDG